MNTAASTMVGFRLDDRYQLVREIGRGGMGVVWEAEHIELAKRVAVKILLDKYADDDEAIIRFRREALAASRIGSPHIIDVSHIGTAPDGRPYVVMELLEGQSLAHRLRDGGPMQVPAALAVIRQVLRATGAAHAKGIVHRDLKPDNIFLITRDDERDFIKILDFGISKFVETTDYSIKTKLTNTGAVMGTPLYMAPEQAMGAPIAPSVDIYACGAILYEMLSGRPPFIDGNYNVIIAKLLTAKPPRLDSLRKKLPKPLVAAVHRALDKDPAVRFATAEAFLAALPVGEHTLAGLPAQPVVRPMSPVRRSALRWLGGGLVLAAAAIGSAMIVDHVVGTPAVTATPAALPAPSPPPAPAPGTLEIRTIPPNATVHVDDADAGTTPIEMTIGPGRHHVRVELRGYTGIAADQDVRAGERTSATFELVPTPAVATPAAATPAAATPAPAHAPVVRPKPPLVPENPYPETSPPPTVDPFGK